MPRMLKTIPHLNVICLFLAIFLLPPGDAEAGDYTCPDNISIEITASDDSMISDICAASGKAIEFLAQYSLLPKRSVKIKIIELSITNHGYVAYGSYNRQNDSIHLMSFPAVLRSNQSPQMYNEPFDREHYHGAIAHEVAHAIFNHNAKNIADQLTNVTQEYLAHSTQLGVLSTERRRKIIAANDVGPWEPGDSISDVYLGLSPTGFAVKSYLHFTQLVDPQPFIKLLLNNNWYYLSVP